MSNTIYITYLTVYSGDLLPPYYIGSTSLSKFESGYKGSVTSKIYKPTWKSEIANNQHLFETIIISEHKTRKGAYDRELEIQIDHKVVKNPLFINQALAVPNGFRGANLKGRKLSEETKRKISESNKGKKMSKLFSQKQSDRQWGKNNPMYGRHHTEKSKLNMSINTSGEKNPMFKGYYHTPFGVLESSPQIEEYTDKIISRTLQDWCKDKSDTMIRKYNISRSKYLTEEMLGKTFKEIGFWFEPV